MKTKQRGFTSMLGVVGVVVIVGAIIYFASRGKTEAPTSIDSNTQNQTQNQQPAASSENSPALAHVSAIKKYSDPSGKFSFSYSVNVFEVQPIFKPISFQGNVSYPGVKLMLSSDVKKVGTQVFRGGSGLPSTFSVEGAGGVEFFLVDSTLDEIRIKLAGSRVGVTSSTVGGKVGLVYKIGAEGEGLNAYFIPVSSTQTLVVQNPYFFKDAFTTDVAESILKTLIVK